MVSLRAAVPAVVLILASLSLQQGYFEASATLERLATGAASSSPLSNAPRVNVSANPESVSGDLERSAEPLIRAGPEAPAAGSAAPRRTMGADERRKRMAWLQRQLVECMGNVSFYKRSDGSTGYKLGLCADPPDGGLQSCTRSTDVYVAGTSFARELFHVFSQRLDPRFTRGQPEARAWRSGGGGAADEELRKLCEWPVGWAGVNISKCGWPGSLNLTRADGGTSAFQFKTYLETAPVDAKIAADLRERPWHMIVLNAGEWGHTRPELQPRDAAPRQQALTFLEGMLGAAPEDALPVAYCGGRREFKVLTRPQKTFCALAGSLHSRFVNGGSAKGYLVLNHEVLVHAYADVYKDAAKPSLSHGNAGPPLEAAVDLLLWAFCAWSSA